jgi:hypothetical protein
MDLIVIPDKGDNMVSRRDFLKRSSVAGISKSASSVGDAVNTPKNTIRAVREYDSTVKDLKKVGNDKVSRRGLFEKFGARLKRKARSPMYAQDIAATTAKVPGGVLSKISSIVSGLNPVGERSLRVSGVKPMPKLLQKAVSAVPFSAPNDDSCFIIDLEN